MTISTQWIPWILTAACIAAMIRPYQQHGDYDFGAILRLFWLIPLSATWAVYFWWTRP